MDSRLLDRNIDKLRFYYGATDHWCPVEYYHDMKKRYPTHNHMYLCEGGHRHAFIIDASEPIADTVADWIKSL